jgi:hypothetical protein
MMRLILFAICPNIRTVVPRGSVNHLSFIFHRLRGPVGHPEDGGSLFFTLLCSAMRA